MSLAVALQKAAGWEITAARIEPRGAPGNYLAVLGHGTVAVALQAGKLAVSLIRWSLPVGAAPAITALRQRVEPAAAIAKFNQYAGHLRLDQTTGGLVAEAERRGIPWFKPVETDSFVQFGYGAKQACTLETVTNHTSSHAVTISRSKVRTNRLLSSIDLPMTRQLVVRTELEVVRAADQIGYPVVVKPDDRGKSRGVTVGVRDRASLGQAFRKAREASVTVLIEALVPGADHRLLVVNGTLVAAAKRVLAQVIGDGQRSVAALVDEVNRDPRRGAGFAKVLVRLALDDEADRMLADAGLTRASVPASGQFVQLRGNANISTGGTAADVTREIHIDNRLAAERAARLVGLNVAGVDFISPDITRSWREVGGAICEVNHSPALRQHWASDGSPDVTARVMDTMMPPGSDGRIPIAALTGGSGRLATLLLGHILGLDGRVVGTATGDGLRIGRHRIAPGDFAGLEGCRILLGDPAVETAAVEAAPSDLVRRGLFFDRCDVAAVLDVGTGPVEFGGITTDDLAKAARLLASTARRLAVLNADDPCCVAMPAGLRAERVCFVSLEAASPIVAAHVATGRPALWLERSGDEAAIILHDGQTARSLSPLSAIPMARDARAIQSALVAAALASGLGTTLDAIRRGFGSLDGAPG